MTVVIVEQIKTIDMSRRPDYITVGLIVATTQGTQADVSAADLVRLDPVPDTHGAVSSLFPPTSRTGVLV